ncbi:MAG: hypothetical protein ACYSWQ_29405 [Planctomycetota bacterium]|jgi:hypothetical protein
MTGYTDIDGNVQGGPGQDIYGPYIQQIPQNQFNDLSDITVAGTTPGAADNLTGWFFNNVTGEWKANDTEPATPAHWDL